MEFSIQNEQLRVTVSTRGAELQSIQDVGGTEYLWQGDPAVWEDRAPNIFPYVGRLTEKSYYYKDKLYHLPIHGFAPKAEFLAEQRSPQTLVMTLTDSPETLAQYPFRFRYDVIYALEGRRLTVTYRVENHDGEKMYFGLGGHPGIRVPLEAGMAFEDYFLEFETPCSPVRVTFSPDCFVTEGSQPFALEEGRVLRLRHDLFDDDAIVLKETARKVTLRCSHGQRFVTMAFPDQPIFGIWHYPHREAPYVCLEPWSSLPSRKGRIERLEEQPDLLSLEPGGTYETAWTLLLG